MANLTAVAALFLALIAGTSAYNTVVTSTVVAEENPQWSCQRELQQMTEMRNCMRYMRGAAANPMEHLQGCCSEVRRFSPECRCDAIRQMMMQAQQQYGMEEQMMMQKAQSLPMMCGMRSPRMCHFSSAVFV